MSSFSFEFKTSAGGKPQAFHFNVHDQNTQKDARDTLVKMLSDLATQAENMEVSDKPLPSGQAVAPADVSDEEETEDSVEDADETVEEESTEDDSEEETEGEEAPESTPTPAAKAPAKAAAKAPAKKK